MSANELSALLWRERLVLQSLLVAQVEAERLLESGHSQPLRCSVAAMESIVNEFRLVALLRDVEVVTVAAAWNATGAPCLGRLHLHAPPGPWRDILTDHLSALRVLADEAVDQRRRITGALKKSGVCVSDRYPVRPEVYTKNR